MIVIHINGTTQQYIADTYTNGNVPEYGVVDGVYTGEDNYFVVMGDGTPNKVVGEEYVEKLNEKDYTKIVIMK